MVRSTSTRLPAGWPAVLLLLLMPLQAALAEDMPSDDAALWNRMLTGEAPIPVEWVAPAARTQLTPAVVATLAEQLQALAGPLESVAQAGDEWRLTFERMVAMAVLTRDSAGLISGLFVKQPTPRAASLVEAAGAITGLAGESALLVTHGDQVLFDHDADLPLLIGSAFKLAVLTVLREEVDAGDMRWDDVLALDAARMSLPSGVLQDFPDGHPLTVATLAALMISVSDNTATDLLMARLDPARLEAVAGVAPLLSTLDYFKIKRDDALTERYAAAAEDERRAIVAELAGAEAPTVADIANANAAHGWRIPTHRLCGLIAGVADLDLMTINPGGLPRGDWDRIAFKGGSDHGVLNLTYLLVREGSAPWCISATRNTDAAIDEAEFLGLVASVAAVLRESAE